MKNELNWKEKMHNGRVAEEKKFAMKKKEYRESCKEDDSYPSAQYTKDK